MTKLTSVSVVQYIHLIKISVVVEREFRVSFRYRRYWKNVDWRLLVATAR